MNEVDTEVKAKNSEMEMLLRQLSEAKEELDDYKERKETLEKGKRVQVRKLEYFVTLVWIIWLSGQWN